MATYFINEDVVESDAAEDEVAEPRSYEVETVADGMYRLVTSEGREVFLDAYAPQPERLQMIVEGESYDATVLQKDGVQAIQIRGEFHEIEVLNERQRRMRAAGIGSRGANGPDLVSPMAGKVVSIACAQGDAVAEGDCIIIVEAMKMENDLKAHLSGAISEIHVKEGDAVEVGDVLISIE